MCQSSQLTHDVHHFKCLKCSWFWDNYPLSWTCMKCSQFLQCGDHIFSVRTHQSNSSQSSPTHCCWKPSRQWPRWAENKHQINHHHYHHNRDTSHYLVATSTHIWDNHTQLVTYDIYLTNIWALTIVLSNGWLNVVIYYLRNRDLRQELRCLLCDWCRCLTQRFLH